MKLSTFIELIAASTGSTMATSTEADANGVTNMMVKGCAWTIENFSE